MTYLVFQCHTCDYDRVKHQLEINEPMEETESVTTVWKHLQNYPDHYVVTVIREQEEE